MSPEYVAKLAKEAGLIFDCPPATAEPLDNYMQAIRKFALLVEREESNRCIDACAEVEGPPGMMGFYDGVRACANAILKIKED